VDLRHTRGQPTQGKEESLLGVDSVTAGSAIKNMPHQEGEILLHRLEQTLEIEGHVETMQLTPVEVGHLQHCCVGEVVNVEALCMQEL
jgi:hypothetical protein